MSTMSSQVAPHTTATSAPNYLVRFQLQQVFFYLSLNPTALLCFCQVFYQSKVFGCLLLPCQWCTPPLPAQPQTVLQHFLLIQPWAEGGILPRPYATAAPMRS